MSKDNHPGRAAGRPRLGVLERSGGGTSLADLLLSAGQEGAAFRVDAVDSLDRLLERAGQGAFEAILLAPELAEGWPVSNADSVMDALAGRVPLVIVCRSPQDAAVIGSRGDRDDVVVLVRERLNGAELAAVLRGELVRRKMASGGGPGAPRPDQADEESLGPRQDQQAER